MDTKELKTGLMELSKKNLKHLKRSGLQLPEEKLFSLPEKVLQFGTGVLLRGLPDYLIDKANRNGKFNGRIVVVKSTGNGGTDDFVSQDNLYTICVRGMERGQLVEENIVCSAISRVLSADREWEGVLNFSRSAALQLVVSNTTEVGITLVEESIHLQPPSSFPAKLLAVLYERYRFFGGSASAGLVIVPTELVPDNGQQLRSIINQLAVFNQLEEEFFNWLELNIVFCNSLVDRIVPGKPDRQLQLKLEAELGYTDKLLVVAEPYHLWAVQGGAEVNDALSFAQADQGVVIAGDIEQFRELKVRLLNGTHTLCCGVAVLSAIATVKDGMNNSALKNYMGTLMRKEIAPAIPFPVPLATAMDFADTVTDRFANPYIDHLWLNIAVQYSMKIKIRVLPVLLNYYQLYGKVPGHIAFGFASFLRVMRVKELADGFYTELPDGNFKLNDDQAGYFCGKTRLPDEQYVAEVLSDTDFWSADLAGLPGFIQGVQQYYAAISSRGITAALNDLAE